MAGGQSKKIWRKKETVITNNILSLDAALNTTFSSTVAASRKRVLKEES